ncbi:hypothetical protein [Azospirillum halopraeferens]|uniref:hypothetical protein n=1 Tax=Azospirillum halopraeferens TaxID=34010 RepID=UPI000418D802|nr:hypothetical protein [Azospirillum halopraeferens]
MADAKEWAALLGLAWLIVAPAGLWWLAKTFPTRRELDAVHTRVTKAEERLADGDRRISGLDASVREAIGAAHAARDAADKATRAAEKIGSARVELAELRGDIKMLTAILTRLEGDSRRMIDGHLSMTG